VVGTGGSEFGRARRGLDGTVLSVALPTLSKALKASESDLQWFTSIYLLVLAASMLPVGLLGDRYGKKKVLLISLAFFGLGSAASDIQRRCGVHGRSSPDGYCGGRGHRDGHLRVDCVVRERGTTKGGRGVVSGQLSLSSACPILGGWLLTHYWWVGSS